MWLIILLLLPLTYAAEGNQTLEPTLNQLLSDTFTFPPLIASITQLALGLKPSEPISFQVFVVLCALWVAVLLIVTRALILVPFFERSNVLIWIAGIVITMLIALTGVLRTVSTSLLDLALLESFFDRWGIVRIIVIAGILAILFFGTLALLQILKKQAALAASRQVGLKSTLK